MKNVLALSIMTVSLVLTACGGGDSDSSGSGNTATPTPAQPATSTPFNPTTGTTTGNTSKGTCPVSGSTVYATTSGCTYSIPNLNGGAAITYTCVGDRVNSSIGMSAKNIILNGVTITCKM